MNRKSLPVVYISGPMTGYEDFNFAAFNEVARKLRLFGFPVLNPADFGAANATHDYDNAYAQAIARDVATLAHAEIMILLPGWEKSKGAGIEFDFHNGVGKRSFQWATEGGQFLREFLTVEEQEEAIRKDRLESLKRMMADFGEFNLFDYDRSGHPDSAEEERRHRRAIEELAIAYADRYVGAHVGAHFGDLRWDDVIGFVESLGLRPGQRVELLAHRRTLIVEAQPADSAAS